MIKEKPYRSLIKTLTWRISATIITIVLVYIFTRELALSFGIGAIEIVLKIIFYYLHERIWNRINFGRVNNEKQ